MNADRELYCYQIDWWLTCRDAACGYRSSLGGQLERIQRGTSALLPNADPYHDGQVGLGPARKRAAFAMDRRFRRRWFTLPAQARDVLTAYYCGALVTAANGNGRQRFPAGVSELLGRFAGVVLFQARDRDALLRACEEQNADALQLPLARAEKAVRAAHNLYYLIAEYDEVPADDARRARRESFAEGAFQEEIEGHPANGVHRNAAGVWRQ